MTSEASFTILDCPNNVVHGGNLSDIQKNRILSSSTNQPSSYQFPQTNELYSITWGLLGCVFILLGIYHLLKNKSELSSDN